MSKKRFSWRVGALVAGGLYACSFQDFEYLKDGVGAAGKRDEGGSGGQSAGTGGVSETGGNSSGGSKAGATGEAGSGMTEAGQGGAGGVAGEGGAAGSEPTGESGAGAGGVDAGGTGGTSATGGTGGTGGTGVVGSKELLNPSFEQGSGVAGWKVDPPEAETKRYVYSQPPSSGSTAFEGGRLLATWDDLDEYELSIFQTLVGLEDGTYTFQGYFSSQASQGAYLFARNCGGEDKQITIPIGEFTWFPIALTGIEVIGGTCEVGLHVHNLPNDWFNADAFTFTKDPE